MGHPQPGWGKENYRVAPVLLLPNRPVLVISPALKEAVTHHAPAKQKEDDYENDCTHQL